MAALIWRPLEGSEVKNNMPSRKYVRCVAVVFQTRCHNSGITTAIIIPSICRITKLSHSHYPYQDGEHHMVVIVIVVAIISIATATTTASAKQRHSTNGVRSQVTSHRWQIFPACSGRRLHRIPRRPCPTSDTSLVEVPPQPSVSEHRATWACGCNSFELMWRSGRVSHASKVSGSMWQILKLHGLLMLNCRRSGELRTSNQQHVCCDSFP